MFNNKNGFTVKSILYKQTVSIMCTLNKWAFIKDFI